MTFLGRALQSVAAFQSHIETEDPDVSIARAYSLPPSGALDLPCFVNDPVGLPEVNLFNSARQRTYTIRSRLFLMQASRANPGDYEDKLLALDEAFQDAFALNIKLGEGALQIQDLRGDAEFFGRLDYDGLGYVGLTYLFELNIHDTVTIGVGAGAE